MPTDILNLHTWTAMGSLQSTIRIEQLMQGDYPVVAITDPNMFGAMDFYREAKEVGKRPIIGLDAYVAFGKVDELKMMYNSMYGNLTLIAMNKTGYTNLVKLNTFAYRFGMYQKPRIDYDTLIQHSEGIACLINSETSNITQHVMNGNLAAATSDMNLLRSVFGDRLYYERLVNGTTNIDDYIGDKVSWVPSNKVLYLNRDDYRIYKLLYAINNNIKYEDVVVNNNYWYKTSKEMVANQHIFHSGHFTNLYQLINQIEEYGLDQIEITLPDMGMDEAEFIHMLHGKMEEQGYNGKQEYEERLFYEIGTIIKFGYTDYFLLVQDVIDHCNNHLSGYMSAGRGSVGGSLVAKLMGITRIDPLHPAGFDTEIPFDRFLNTGRKVMPDIDLDFLPRDRPAIIEYLKKTYGDDSVKNMVTTVTLGARSALREVCRITGNLNDAMSNIIKSFPQDQHLTLGIVKDSDIYEKNKDNPTFLEMFESAERLEGLPRSLGIHASGIALSTSDMKDNVPFFVHNSGKEATQYNQDQLEYLGVVKLDILGLNTLQIMNDALNLIKTRLHRDFETMGFNLPKEYHYIIEQMRAGDDMEVVNFIKNGNTAGVFQWYTHNYKVVIKRVQPDSFKELVDLNTLGRSAALLSGLTDQYINRKFGVEAPEPLHPSLAGMMKQTYGLPLYQEQIMEIFMKVANYTSSEADDVRKAIGKKIPELMMKQKEKFTTNCLGKGMTEQEVDSLWSIIEKFSKYTWNLGHAMGYTQICYETAWLAYHYPAEYFCACINNAEDSVGAGQYISVLKCRGIEVLPPDINESQAECTVKDGKVLSGFSGLKYLGKGTIEKLQEIRKERPFEDMADFNQRVPKKVINKTAFQSLLVANAFSTFQEIDEVELEKRVSGILFHRLIYNQYRMCGHVYQDVRKLEDDQTLGYIKDLASTIQVTIPAYVVSIREIYTKKKSKMAFVVLEDVDGRHDIVFFPAQWGDGGKFKVGDLIKLVLKYDKGLVCSRLLGRYDGV